MWGRGAGVAGGGAPHFIGPEGCRGGGGWAVTADDNGDELH
jgi:hypothetical protein